MATNKATNAGSFRSPAPGLDIFRTPENKIFYAANPYQRLDRRKQEIRLIEISTQIGEDGMLECKLLPAMQLVDAQNRYLALSYCAGDPADTQDILVNGVRCNVFANLHHALVLARRYWIRSSGQGPLRLWVDQLCINQHDFMERSHQVGFMREIYQSAERTLACLSTTKTGGKGLKWLIDLCEAVPSREDDHHDVPFKFELRGESYSEYNPGLTLTARGSKKTPNSCGCCCNRDDRHQSRRMRKYLWENMLIEQFVDGWIAFYDVLSSPWWNRAWICQEFLVSAQVSFLFGYDSVPWEQCWKTMQCFCKKHSSDLLNRDQFLGRKDLAFGCPEDRHFCRILDIVQERDLNRQVNHVMSAVEMKIDWNGSMDIKDLLSHSRSCKSSDDRDRVYAMLGLASPGYNIFPDYSNDMSAVEVMTLTTRAIIEKEKSLEILVQATKLVQSRNLDVPSWVVDWSSIEDWDTEFWSQCFITHEPPQCAFETITDANGQTRARVLQVYGTFITNIHPVGRSPVAMFYGTQRGGWSGRAFGFISEGDELWFLYGSRVPMILRSYLDGYRVVSSAYLLGGSSKYAQLGRVVRCCIRLY